MLLHLFTVQWSDEDSRAILSAFKDWVMDGKETNKGGLPSKFSFLQKIHKYFQ